MTARKVRVSPRQIEILDILARFDCECWGEVWSHCYWPGKGAQAFSRFDAVSAALMRNGLVASGDDRLKVTDQGRAVLGLGKDGAP